MQQKRKQFHSCDRCRQGRRACDAAKRGINPFPAATNQEDGHHQQQQKQSGQALACSLCEKANKTCSFTWLRQRTRGQLPESIKRKYLRDTPLAHHMRTPENLQSTSSASSTSPASQVVQSSSSGSEVFLYHHRETQSLVYEDNIARELGRDTTSDRLFHVYASSFERTISKWATPTNQDSPGIVRYPALHNTLYDRVQRLDGKASALIVRHTSPDHCHRAIKALRLAVMAFASQSSCIKRVIARNEPGISQEYNDVFVSGNDFQTLLFQTLWHETRRSLEWFAETDCLESILAKIIFCLTQSPYDSLQLNSRHKGSVVSRRDPHAYDSPEVMALRKAHFDKALQSLSVWNKELQPLFQDPERLKHIDFDDDDITSFCFFVKFAVICDETSAVLWNRDLLIVEEEGDITWPRNGFGKFLQTLSKGFTSSSPLVQSKPPAQSGQIQPHNNNTHQPLHLPWNNLITAGIFLKANSLKASLWRKLGQLRRFARRDPALTENPETHIQETLQLFHEWDVSCASFIENCMASITTSPFDLQASCFGHVTHWHLAALLFATEVELLDATGRSDRVRSSLRRSTGLTWELRKDSIYAISDLARAANRLAMEGVSRHIDTRRGDYYEHPLLVDPPFAVIHIAFSETCEILMEWRNQLLFKLSDDQHPRASPEQRHQDESYLADILERLDHCINTLDLLGTKSGVSKGYAYDLRARLDRGLY